MILLGIYAVGLLAVLLASLALSKPWAQPHDPAAPMSARDDAYWLSAVLAVVWPALIFVAAATVIVLALVGLVQGFTFLARRAAR